MSGPRYSNVGRDRSITEELIDRRMNRLPQCVVCGGLVDLVRRVAEDHGRILQDVRIGGVAQVEPCPGSGQPPAREAS